VDTARRGDPDAFAVLVRAHQDLAFRAAYLITGDAGEAEDVTQDAFVKAYQPLSRFRSGAPFRPWLLKIVTNEARNRRLSSRKRADREANSGRDPMAVRHSPPPEHMVLASERRRYLLHAVRRLSEQDQMIMDAKVLNRIAVKAAGSRPGIPWMSRRLVLGMAAAATVVIATVLALSPAARATLTPWWASDSNCPGPISGQQLVIKSATAKQLCNSGIVLTRPVGRAVIRRSQAIAAARKRFPFKSVRETVLATVHEQGSVPTQTWLAWVVSIPPGGGRPAGGGPAPAHDRRVATRRYHGLFFLVFIDARSGKFHEATASYALVRPAAPRYVYSAVTFTDGKDGFILAAKPSTGRYLLATTDDGRTWMPRRLPFSPNWFQYLR
jgi:RNA polymerase sigma factor (sigma-70 family)